MRESLLRRCCLDRPSACNRQINRQLKLMEKFFSRLLRFNFSLILAVFGLVFAISLLAAAPVMMLVGLVRWAVTGKKPAPVVAFSQFKKFRAGQRNPFSSKSAGPPGDVVDVVDVEVRDVTPQKSDVKDGKLLP